MTKKGKKPKGVKVNSMGREDEREKETERRQKERERAQLVTLASS